MTDRSSTPPGSPADGVQPGKPPAASTALIQRGRPFAAGVSGNPAGRRPGSKNRLTDVFMTAIVDDFTEHGAAAIAQVRRDDPGLYLRIIGALVPRELVVQREREPNVDIENLSFTDLMELVERLERNASIRRALLDAERG